jgi:hypothetical protein
MSNDPVPGPDFQPLTYEAAGILQALLSEPFAGRDALIKQLVGCHAHPIDGNGSLALRPGQAPRANVEYRVPVTGLTTDSDGVGIEVLLHVVDGYLDELEIYRHDGGQLLRPVEAATLRLEILPVVG